MTRTLTGLQAILLGVAVLLGLALIGMAIFAVGSREWLGEHSLEVRAGFANVNGVEVGTRVRVRGMDAGEVVALEPPSSTDSQVFLRLRIRGTYRHLVRTNASVQIVSVGMLGAKAVEIDPGSESAEPAADGTLLASRPASEMSDVINQVQSTLSSVVDGKGTLGKLARDPEAYDALVGLVRQTQSTMMSVQRDADALKKIPYLGGFVEDPQSLLVRPRHQRHRKWFRETELFDPGRAVVTSTGRARLDDLRDWLERHKQENADIVIVSYGAEDGPDAARTKVITEEQSRAVADYLKDTQGIHKRGIIPWYHSVRVAALGLGTAPMPTRESETLPRPRLEVLIFVPQN